MVPVAFDIGHVWVLNLTELAMLWAGPRLVLFVLVVRGVGAI